MTFLVNLVCKDRKTARIRWPWSYMKRDEGDAFPPVRKLVIPLELELTVIIVITVATM